MKNRCLTISEAINLAALMGVDISRETLYRQHSSRGGEIAGPGGPRLYDESSLVEYFEKKKNAAPQATN
jgi:hypothetical protein